MAQLLGAPLAGAGPAPAVGWGACPQGRKWVPHVHTVRDPPPSRAPDGVRTGRKMWSAAFLISEPLSCA